MPKRFLILPLTLAFLAAATPSHAVSCDAVNRELKLGRWPEDTALAMGITLAEVNDCKSKGDSATVHHVPPSGSGAVPQNPPPRDTGTKGK